MSWKTKIEAMIVNSKWWYHVYYKHTKQHKKDLAETKARALKRRKEIIGK